MFSKLRIKVVSPLRMSYTDVAKSESFKNLGLHLKLTSVVWWPLICGRLSCWCSGNDLPGVGNEPEGNALQGNLRRFVGSAQKRELFFLCKSFGQQGFFSGGFVSSNKRVPSMLHRLETGPPLSTRAVNHIFRRFGWTCLLFVICAQIPCVATNQHGHA